MKAPRFRILAGRTAGVGEKTAERKLAFYWLIRLALEKKQISPRNNTDDTDLPQKIKVLPLITTDDTDKAQILRGCGGEHFIFDQCYQCESVVRSSFWAKRDDTDLQT